MKQINRRLFLKRAGGGAAGTFLVRGASVWAADTVGGADLVLKNGAIVTMCDAHPVAEAMAVRGGRVLAVGSNDEIAKVAGGARVIDLAGQGVSPGIIDAHSHVMSFGQMQLKFVILRPPEIDSFATLFAKLSAAASARPAGEWIVGRGFNAFKEGRWPRREELDTAAPNHPVLIVHWGGQFGIANTLALKKANLLRADAQDPYGGKYLRDKRTGLPDGVLIHYPAIYSVYQPELTPEEQTQCAEWGFAQFTKLGVTCIHDNFSNARSALAYVQLERAGRLPCRVRVYPYVKNLQTCQQLVASARRYNGPLVRLQGVKLAVDGYALMYDIPQQHRDLAIPMHPQEQFNAIIAAIHNAGLQADVHAVGDKGVDWTLAAYAQAAGSPAECRRRRHRIEHFPFRKADALRRAAELGVPVCEQPNIIEVKADDIREKFGSTNQAYLHTMVPLRSFIKDGVPVAFGADVPAFPSHLPLDSIRSAIDRMTLSGRQLDPAESVSFLEALRIHTLGSAYAAFDEKELGSLEPGKYADFVIWDRDLRQVRTGRDACALKVMATYMDGKAVYTAPKKTG
ncbi:MAG: amidohydrolase [bacterium]|nr:amidohydrolase [Candidatus Sumerlaeota bacterium]